MGIQAGVWYFDERPIDPGLSGRLRESLAAWGPDGQSDFRAPGLLMVHCGLHVNAHDRRERQPVSRRGQHVMTWDGRLDNREDLLMQLRSTLDDDDTDAALVWAAYAKWGDAAFARLVGDWSLLVWDQQSRQLKLASDYMGIRPLYYYADDTHVSWSTNLGELVLREGQYDELDEEYLAGFLVTVLLGSATPYRRIQSVPAAHCVAFAAGQAARVHAFWRYTHDTIRYSSEATYEEHLRSVFAEAVRARLRADRSVWAELSGGLDSSAVACVADRLITAGVTEATVLKTVSIVTDQSRESDERSFIADVERQLGRPGTHVNADKWIGELRMRHSWVVPVSYSGTRLQTLDIVRKAGDRVVLSGQAGDTVMGNTPDNSIALIEPLRSLSMARFVPELRRWSRGTKKPAIQILGGLLPAALPASLIWRWHLRKMVRQLTGRGGTSAESASPDLLIRDDLFDVVRSELRSRAKRVAAFPDRTKHELLTEIDAFASGRLLQTPTEQEGVLRTHPFADRSLVQFVLSIPSSVLNRPGETRSLMRRALSTALPARICRRFSKGYAAPMMIRSLRAALSELEKNPAQLHIVERDYIDREKLARSISRLRGGDGSQMGKLRMCVLVEHWLHERESCRDSLVGPHRAMAS